MSRLSHPRPEYGPQYSSLWNQYTMLEAQYTALRNQQPPDYNAINAMSAQITAVVDMANQVKRMYQDAERQRREAEERARWEAENQTQTNDPVSVWDTPVDTDAAIEEGANQAVEDWTPAHDIDAPLSPSYDYTPTAVPSAPTLPSTPSSDPTPTSDPTPQMEPMSRPRNTPQRRPRRNYNTPLWQQRGPWSDYVHPNVARENARAAGGGDYFNSGHVGRFNRPVPRERGGSRRTSPRRSPRRMWA